MQRTQQQPQLAPVTQLPGTPDAPMDDDEEVIDIGQYWRIIKRHKWGIAGIAALFLVLGVLYALLATPIYRAEVELVADPITPNPASNSRSDQFVASQLVFLFYETQYSIIQSRTIAERVVDRLGLVAKAKAKKTATAESTTEDTLSGKLRQWKKAIKDALDLSALLPEELRPRPQPEPTDAELRTRLATNIQAHLKVEGGKQSKVIKISYESPDPKEAAAIANAVANAYIEFGLDSRLGSAKKTTSWLNDQLGELKRKLDESEQALQNYQREKGIVDTSQQRSLASAQLSTLTTELIKAQTRRSEAQIRYNQIRKGNYASNSVVLSNPTVRDLIQTEAALSRKAKEYAERYGAKHPKMKAVESDLNEARRNLKREINKIVSSVKKEYQVAAAQERKLTNLIAEQKKDLGALKGTALELNRLEREVENNRKLYESFLARFQEADVSEKYDTSNVRVIDPAVVPENPAKPRKGLIISIATVMGAFLGVLLAFLRESLDNSFKTTDDVEDKLGISNLGLVPVLKPAERMKTPAERQLLNDHRSMFAENINNIRTSLLFSTMERPPQTILITSSTASEGKTTLACNLASSLSQLGNTLLLETDLRRPSIANALGIQADTGLSDLLSNNATPQDIVHTLTDGEHQLYVMTCGTPPLNPLELLSSGRFSNLLEQLKKRFEYIVLDAPPVMAVSDAAVLGQSVDSVLFAIRSEETTTKLAYEGLSRLRKSHVKVTGGVLTFADARRMSYYGGHYRYDKNTSYYGYRAEPGKASTG